ncbi:hypothetical protein ACFL3F_04880, partial [Planctomycetota bacterium]
LYGIFTNASSPHSHWTEESHEHFLEAYRRAYFAIKETKPDAIVVGPNAQWGKFNWWWARHEGHYLWFVKQFIDYCIENDCLPDVLAWHDWTCDGHNMLKDAIEIRKYFTDKGMDPPLLEQDDFGCSKRQFRPGTFVSYLANIERAKYAYAAKCCWDKDCFGGTLNGLLTKKTFQRRSLWWMYKAYADMTGEIVDVSSGLSVDAIASYDSTLAVIRVVAGRYEDVSGPVTFNLNNPDPSYTKADVLGKRIINSEDLSLDPPTNTIEFTKNIRNHEIVVELHDLEPWDAYEIVITLTDKVAARVDK